MSDILLKGSLKYVGKNANYHLHHYWQYAVEFIDPNKEIPKGLLIFLIKVFIGDSESVEKNHPLTVPFRSCQPVSTGQSAQMAISAGAAWLVTPKGHCWGMIFSTDSRSPMATLLRKIDKPFGIFCFGWKNLQHTVLQQFMKKRKGYNLLILFGPCTF